MTPFEERIKKYLMNYIDVNEDEFQHFIELTESLSVKKGDVLLQSGKRCKYQYFIIEGLLISNFVSDSGENKVIQISTENTWTGDLSSYTTNQPNNRIITAYEDSELILLKKENWEILMTGNGKFEKLFRMLFQNAYIQQTKRLERSMKLKSRERLENFVLENPQLVNRVQNKIIASYLDMTPETFSRLSKKYLT